MGQGGIQNGDSEADTLRCPACDYDLRALTSDRCPECGVLIDRQALSISQIPWTHRKSIGRYRAFQRTVWLTFIRPKRIAMDIARPVSFTDAKKFQNAVIWCAFLPVLAMAIWAVWGSQDTDDNGVVYHGVTGKGYYEYHSHHVPIAPPHGRILGWVLQYIGIALMGFCIWLAIKAATGVSSYFFHPRDLSMQRQNRAVALSYYACAPLAWTPITAVLLSALILMTQAHWSEAEIVMIRYALMIVTGVSILLQIGGWWRCSASLLVATTRCSGFRATTMRLSLPFLWLLCVILTVGIPLAAYSFVCVVILDLVR